MDHDKIDLLFFGAMTVLICMMIVGSITAIIETNDFTESCNNRNGVAVMTTTGITCIDKGVILK
jgi:hypothetical protein